MRQSLNFLLLTLLLFTGHLFADEPGVRKFEIPVENGEFRFQDIIQTVLNMGGSRVVLPDDFPDQTLKANGPTARITVFTWNAILKDFGVKLTLNKQALSVRMDLKTFESTLDRFEQMLLDVFNIERTAELIRMSPPKTTGPVVILVHGLDSSKRLFHGSTDFLVEKGYDVYFFEYPNDDRVKRNAERLSEALKTLPPERQTDLTLVTVSMGGLITQLMLESPELNVKGVKQFIACVPPFQGSEMAALRGFVEVGDHAMNLIFDPKKALDFWGDGMGRAGIDLQPRSLLLEELAALKRNPDVRYSILAGNKGIFDPTLLQKTRKELADSPADNPVAETARRLTLDRMDLMLKFQSPHGDGVVTLESATLEGVTDREVLPHSHLEFLTGFFANEDIPALKQVLNRLPEVE